MFKHSTIIRCFTNDIMIDLIHIIVTYAVCKFITQCYRSVLS